jgi:thiol-disulfide isomerase/thioredoxin
MKKPFLALAVSLFLLGQEFCPGSDTGNPVIAPHAKDLVVLAGEKLESFKAPEFLKAPYMILYYGAGWCPDCRRFSPTLVGAYNQQPKGERQFEVLLISRDKSADGMLKFMKAEKMAWPALAFDKIESADDLKKFYSGHGIPCLSIIDPSGKLILQSRSDQDAADVLRELQELLKSKGPK